MPKDLAQGGIGKWPMIKNNTLFTEDDKKWQRFLHPPAQICFIAQWDDIDIKPTHSM